MFKKFLPIILTMSMLLGGCGSKQTEQTSTTEKQSSTTTQEVSKSKIIEEPLNDNVTSKVVETLVKPDPNNIIKDVKFFTYYDEKDTKKEKQMKVTIAVSTEKITPEFKDGVEKIIKIVLDKYPDIKIASIYYNSTTGMWIDSSIITKGK